MSRVAKTLVACSIVAVISFLIGSSLGQRAMLKRSSYELDSVQASLTFNHLLDERHWRELLSKGCTAQAEKSLDAATDKDMELLSELANGKVDADTIKYISDRDPGLIERLKTFKSKYGRSWLEEACKA